MNKLLKQTIFLISIIIFLILPDFVFATSAATPLGALQGVGGKSGYDTGVRSPTTIINTIITTALSLLGVIFMILVIYGGFLRMTARGDDTQVANSTKIITAAVIGMIIVVSAYTITKFVTGSLAGGG